MPSLALNFIDKRGGSRFGSFAEEGAGALESVAHDFFHLVLRVANEIAAGVIQLAGKHGGDFAGPFPQANLGLLTGTFREMLNLCLRFFLVPLGGFQQIIDNLVLGALGFAFQVGEAARRNSVGAFAQ